MIAHYRTLVVQTRHSGENALPLADGQVRLCGLALLDLWSPPDAQILAKQKAMKKPGRSIAPQIKPALSPTGNRVVLLMRSIKAELEKAREVTYDMLGRYTGQSASAALEKFHRPHQPQVEGLISLLERMPPQVRHQLLDKACRTFPTLNHPRIAHDPVQVSQLRTLLEQPTGLTVVHGGNAGLRTFVASALGHQIQLAESGGHSVSGIDVHQPDWFVPVDGVIYLNNLLVPKMLRSAILNAWQRMESEAPSRLVLFNGIHMVKDSFSAKILQAARASHVIVADEWDHAQLASHVSAPFHAIRVAADLNDRIKCSVQAS